MLCFVAAYVPLECMVRPPAHSAKNAAMLFVQLAWLVPMLPVWRWNARLKWNLRYFLSGLFMACGILFSLMLLSVPYAPWDRSGVVNILFIGLSLGFIAGLFALKASSIQRALGIGVVALFAQIAALILVMVVFFPSIVV